MVGGRDRLTDFLTWICANDILSFSGSALSVRIKRSVPEPISFYGNRLEGGSEEVRCETCLLGEVMWGRVSRYIG